MAWLGVCCIDEPDRLEGELESQAHEEGFSGKKFGTLSGVFTPTMLTILGVIMYLRLGWVVGNAGLLGAVVIILIAFGITLTTGLSLSSMVTNIRIGGGGAYSVISRSLGIEVGGSIGVPLFISQGLAVSMYIFGFREGWLYVFPDHNALLVDLVVFGLLFGIAMVSSGFAFRIQYLILGVIVASLVSVAGAVVMGSMVHEPTWIGGFPGQPEAGFQGVSFWFVFAVFFPAATGIMAGANMSGDLKDPRKSIPLGTVAAIVLALAVYLGLAYWLATSASMEELASNYTIMVDLALWPPAIIAGLLGATFSSALASLVGAPRILEALGAHRILPKGAWLSERSARGEPHRALLVTGAIVLAALMLRSLNTVAPLITMFFLITYAMVNVVVLVEQSLGLASFRPLLRVPRLVPLLGGVGCIFTMFIIDATFGLVAVAFVVAVYAYLTHRSLDAPYGDMRSGLFYALSEWGARKVGSLEGSNERAWKANLLVPADERETLRRNHVFLRNLAYPNGTLRLLGVRWPGGQADIEPWLEDAQGAFEEEGLFVTTTHMQAATFEEGVHDAVQALRGTFFRPNILFLPVPTDPERVASVQTIIDRCTGQGTGALLFQEHARAGLGRRRRINLIIPDQGPTWRVGMDLGNLDLAILTAYQVARNWDASLRVIANVEDPDRVEDSKRYLEQLADVARLPPTGEHVVVQGSLDAALDHAPDTDLTVLPHGDGLDAEGMQDTIARTESACVFTIDAGDENALA